MGYSSVDVAVVFREAQDPVFACAKPSSRAAMWWSLSVPVVLYGQLSHIELCLQYGYPLVRLAVPVCRA